MIVLTLVVGVVNLGLGYGIAVYLQSHANKPS